MRAGRARVGEHHAGEALPPAGPLRKPAPQVQDRVPPLRLVVRLPRNRALRCRVGRRICGRRRGRGRAWGGYEGQYGAAIDSRFTALVHRVSRAVDVADQECE